MDVTSLTATWRWNDNGNEVAPEVVRLRKMLSASKLIHPFLLDDKTTVANFRDLASAYAQCCGLSVDKASSHSEELAQQLGGIERQHIVLILCDGMGNSILNRHLSDKKAFLHRFNQPFKLRSVFPSTTPAALTTLATAQWPGQHGVPGWDLREVLGCEYPGEPQDTVQLRVLSNKITDARTGNPTCTPWDDVFLAKPWARSIRQNRAMRQMIYINAYNQGNETKEKITEGSDFSSWQMGGVSNGDPFQSAKIGETVAATLGEPEGSEAAIQYFADGIDAALSAIADAESQNKKSFVYLYTAHPDKHMHALGTEHSEVEAVVKGLNDQIERLWTSLRNRKTFLREHGKDCDTQDEELAVDATVVVTADHGHITVQPDEMIQLPESISECLEYANIGVHGKGRHAYLHCKAGLQSILRERWRSNPPLNNSFLLLTIEEAAAHSLFGPEAPLLKVRPRLGDFVAIATRHATLVSPKESAAHSHHCQGAHGSLLPEEMEIPFVLCTPV
jgi:hypothetical protein